MLWEILKASKGILVADLYADLWANIAGGGTPVDVFVEMIGTLPLYYNGKGYNLTDYLISGNAVQDGTPSADAPVDAVGSGVRTGNLASLYKTNYYVKRDGTEEALNGFNLFSAKIEPSTTYTLSAAYLSGGGSTVRCCEYDASCAFISYPFEINLSVLPVTFTTSQDAKTVKFSVTKLASNIMLNLGSTALPYEPYGFKLPLTVNGAEYPIYLGQVETTRRIKKLVLTGEEAWGKDVNIDELDDYFYTDPISGLMRTSSAISSHFVSGSKDVVDSVWIGGGASSPRIVVEIRKLYTGITSADDRAARIVKFKSYLAQQYAAGTPVTVWYVLAEPETAVVNEPLMKIGDYADTISFAQAGVTIPTVNGANVLDMTSPVKPSEVYIKGKGIKPMEGGS